MTAPYDFFAFSDKSHLTGSTTYFQLNVGLDIVSWGDLISNWKSTYLTKADFLAACSVNGAPAPSWYQGYPFYPPLIALNSTVTFSPFIIPAYAGSMTTGISAPTQGPTNYTYDDSILNYTSVICAITNFSGGSVASKSIASLYKQYPTGFPVTYKGWQDDNSNVLPFTFTSITSDVNEIHNSMVQIQISFYTKGSATYPINVDWQYVPTFSGTDVTRNLINQQGLADWLYPSAPVGSGSAFSFKYPASTDIAIPDWTRPPQKTRIPLQNYLFNVPLINKGK